jgi:hypothetical protein
LPGGGLAAGESGFGLAVRDRAGKIKAMRVEDVKRLAERQPFRLFAVRLNNGAQYTFNEPRNFGAPGDYHMIFFFGESDWAMLDTESIVEVTERK